VEEDERVVRLYYGEQTKDDLCFTDLYSLWEERGYQVVPVLSQQSNNNITNITRCRYVQNDALEEDGVPFLAIRVPFCVDKRTWPKVFRRFEKRQESLKDAFSPTFKPNTHTHTQKRSTAVTRN
jgi:hypothetical protein